MSLKERKNGGWMVSCMGYPGCKAAVWFPESVVSAEVLDAVCEHVSLHVYYIIFAFSHRKLTLNIQCMFQPL